MKKFLSLVMALALLCSTFSFTFAETVSCIDNGHSFVGEVTVVTAPTCLTEGVNSQYCERCKQEIETVVPALGHTAGDATPLEHTDATCTEGSTALYAKCARCNATNITLPYEPAKGHAYDNDKTDPKNYKEVAPTCTEKGYTEYFCIRDYCNHSKIVYDKDELGHDWQIAEGQVDATCYADGVSGQYIYCYRCKLHVADDFVDANGNGVKDEGELSVDAHYVEALSHSEATAFGKAFVDTFFVYDAAGNFVDVTPYVWKMGNGTTVLNPLAEDEEYAWPLSHSAAVTIEYKAQTCTEDGYVTVKCACGNFERTEVIKAKGHLYDMMAVKYVDANGNTQELVLTIEDYAAYIGEEYGETIEAIADFTEIDITVEKLLQIAYKLEYITEDALMADCTIRPIAQYICVHCEERVDGQADACDEHFFGSNKDIQAYLNGDNDVIIGRILKIKQLQVPEYDGNDDDQRYEREDQIEVTATLADFDAKIAKCTEYEVTIGCIHCAVTKTVTLNTNAKHQYDAAHTIEIRPSTCTAAGLQIKHCADVNCGYSVAESLPLANHEADLTKTVVVAASCTADGTRTFTCKNCGHQWTEKIPSYGHNYKWEITKEAGCKVEGEKKLTCTRCGDVKDTQVIPEAHVFATINDITAMTNVTKEAIDAARVRVDVKNAEGEVVAAWMLPEVPWTDCTKAGNLQFVCINCKAVTITKAAGEHEWYNTEITDVYSEFVSDEICRYNYTQHYACENCVQTSKAKLHEDFAHEFNGNYSEVYIPTSTAPTCKESGLGFYPCLYCGEHFVDEVPAFNHSYETIYDAKAGAWTYVCEWCGEVETAEYAVEKYQINTDSIVWGNKTTGTGYVTLDNTVLPSYVLGQRYAFIQWTWVTKAGDNVVADTVVELKSLGQGEYSFNAKGVSVAGATLDNVVIIITDDADAADFSCTNYGYTVMD